jgi:hypothetical protein
VSQVLEEVGAAEDADRPAAPGDDDGGVARREVGEDGLHRLADIDRRQGRLHRGGHVLAE